MRKLWWMITFLLCLSGGYLGQQIRQQWKHTWEEKDPSRISPRLSAPVPGVAFVTYPDFDVIAMMNPFNPERNDVIATPESKPLGPQPVVYGSIILGESRFALLGNENDQKPQKIAEGQMFNGYQVKKVKGQSVVLEAGGQSTDIMFYNALSRIRRDVAKTQSATQAPPALNLTETQAQSAPAAQTSGSIDKAATQQSSATPQAMPPSGSSVPAGKKTVRTPFGTMTVDK